MKDGKPVLEFVAIKRKDTGSWAIPGVSGKEERALTPFVSTHACLLFEFSYAPYVREVAKCTLICRWCEF